MDDDVKTEAAMKVVRLAKELAKALAEADDVGLDMYVSYSEVNLPDKRLKHVLAHARLDRLE
ncbi:hypothetical protein QN219_04930 [Sinorhizobium sp. 7-81]|uniref:hypothetical protein n=1 Tax=Sinorhizobium sp. 8-89 TaxID=3049089 RepID=UPI0024C24B80|nr:hypothetical protein [Sinorhizobium sp. 8-89]MDK1489400.1 hypothetical protein [Sinorhizobium sp. 8-89]